ncbi:antitoxin Xre-like helix-turn-helix domain-containing protein [Breoghania sp.]|uniref:type II RES/Xre toxin-antitoxin system antitoxin n=1 Tax=Breoghania sp. TaxID=2065378 RepID=UPI0029C87969|nr:antitoxin Xre-like helix-turn-helix domain-containing protein [Breoghania sp.]
MFGSSIGIKLQNTSEVIVQIQKGLPISAFTRLKKNLDVSDKELSKVLRIPVSTLARRKKGKRFMFEESERIFRIARLFDKAVNVFGEEELARKWLKEPAWALGDVAPVEYARTELGAHEVESLLGRIEDGVFT